MNPAVPREAVAAAAAGHLVRRSFVQRVAAGDLAAYPDSGHLTSAAGLVPVPRDSGQRTGNLHRPKRYSRRLRRVFFLSAQACVIRDGPNRDYCLKKRREGCKHVQAVIALVHRRVDVLSALLRDGRLFTHQPRRQLGVEAVFVTMGLLDCDLAEAQRAFFSARCRDAERRFHNVALDLLAKDVADDA